MLWGGCQGPIRWSLVLFFRHHSHSPLTREQSRLCSALGPLGILTFCSFSLEYSSPPFLRKGHLSLPASMRGPSGLLPLCPTLTPYLTVSPARLGPPRQSQSLVCPLLNPSLKHRAPWASCKYLLRKWINSELRVKPNFLLLSPCPSS